MLCRETESGFHSLYIQVRSLIICNKKMHVENIIWQQNILQKNSTSATHAVKSVICLVMAEAYPSDGPRFNVTANQFHLIYLTDNS